MFTQCRGCGEIFGLAVDDLVAAEAKVRCSSCGTVFNALETLAEYKPQEGFDLMLNENDNPPPLLNHEFKANIIQPKLNKTEQATEDDKQDIFDKQEQDDDIEDIGIFNVKPEFVDDQNQRKSKSHTGLWLLGTLGLLGLFTWQASLALQNGSIVLPEGALKTKICEKINCFHSQKASNINKIALVSRNIRQHPGRDNALIITTGIINSDEQIQEYPALQIKMSNLNGEIVAMRRFLPSEYLDEDVRKIGMLSNTLIPITLELQSPGKNAVTFEISFSPTYGKE